MPRPRRVPNFAAFIGTGVVVGFVIGSALAYFGPKAPNYSGGTAVAFLGVIGACVFGLLAAIVAVLLDRRG